MAPVPAWPSGLGRPASPGHRGGAAGAPALRGHRAGLPPGRHRLPDPASGGDAGPAAPRGGAPSGPPGDPLRAPGSRPGQAGPGRGDLPAQGGSGGTHGAVPGPACAAHRIPRPAAQPWKRFARQPSPAAFPARSDRGRSAGSPSSSSRGTRACRRAPWPSSRPGWRSGASAGSGPWNAHRLPSRTSARRGPSHGAPAPGVPSLELQSLPEEPPGRYDAIYVKKEPW